MGRSVSYPFGCSVVCFQDVTSIDESWEWDDHVESIIYSCRAYAPSLHKIEKWLGREDRAVLENDFAYIGISEYCGLAAVWMLPKDHPLAAHWCDRFGKRFRQMFSEYRPIATASNDETFYERIEA